MAAILSAQTRALKRRAARSSAECSQTGCRREGAAQEVASTVDRRPTLETVAREAGVSRQTVSNALNAPHRLDPRTLARVLAAVERVGYRPNAAARHLATSRSRVVGVRLEHAGDGINGAVLDRFLHALTVRAQAAAYRVMLFVADGDDDEVARYAELVEEHQVDAFVLASTHHGDRRTRWLAERGAAFVAFGRPWDGPAAHPWVDVDGAAGTAAATRHLLERGHRRVAFVGWPVGSGVGDDRRRGWRTTMRAAGTDDAALDALALGVAGDPAAGADAARTLLDRRATAFVCATDALALGVLEAARERGARVAVVGFDDTPVAAAVGLTSVRQPLDAVADAVVERLLDVLALGDRPGAPRHVLLDPELVVRGSSIPTPTEEER